MSKNMIALIFMTAALVTLPGMAQTEEDARIIRFGFREISPKLGNDEMRLKIQVLKNRNAQLERRPDDIDLVRIAVDRYLIEQDKDAIKVSNWFAQVWSDTGDKELQRKLSDIEKQFDEADRKCHHNDKELDDSTVSVTLATTNANCVDVHKIYLVVSQYQIKIAIPPPSIFKHTLLLTRLVKASCVSIPCN